LPDFNHIWVFKQIYKVPNIKFYTHLSRGSWVHTCRQTDRHGDRCFLQLLQKWPKMKIMHRFTFKGTAQCPHTLHISYIKCEDCCVLECDVMQFLPLWYPEDGGSRYLRTKLRQTAKTKGLGT